MLHCKKAIQVARQMWWAPVRKEVLTLWKLNQQKDTNDTILDKILFTYKSHSNAISANFDEYIKGKKSSNISLLSLFWYWCCVGRSVGGCSWKRDVYGRAISPLRAILFQHLGKPAASVWVWLLSLPKLQKENQNPASCFTSSHARSHWYSTSNNRSSSLRYAAVRLNWCLSLVRAEADPKAEAG